MCRKNKVDRACRRRAASPRPAEIIVLATPTAKEKHGKDLCVDLDHAGFGPELRAIPEGGASRDLWQQFEIIKTALRAPAGMQVILDITHGFRSQPFFAAAVVAFIRAVDVREVPLFVVYGGFDAKDAPPRRSYLGADAVCRYPRLCA